MAAAGPALGSMVCGPHYQTLGQVWILSGLLVDRTDRTVSESSVSRAGAGTKVCYEVCRQLLVTRCVGRNDFRQIPEKAPVLGPREGRGAQDCSWAGVELSVRIVSGSWLGPDSAGLLLGALTGVPSGFLGVGLPSDDS